MLDEIKITAPDTVYPPLEDSQLLAQVAIQECDGKILEVGCGSGYIGICVAKFKKGAKIIAVDINSDAVECAIKNAKENGVKIEVRRSDLFEKVVEKDFDWILFNPPYLPTSEAERIEGGLNFAFDGGESGLDTVFRFFERAGAHLKKEGKILIVASDAQDLKELEKKMRACGFGFEIVARQDFFFEKICVYRLEMEGSHKNRK